MIEELTQLEPDAIKPPFPTKPFPKGCQMFFYESFMSGSNIKIAILEQSLQGIYIIQIQVPDFEHLSVLDSS